MDATASFNKKKREIKADEVFDIIFHPVFNGDMQDVTAVRKECYRVLKKGGILLAGLDNGPNDVFDEEETAINRPLPFDPPADEALFQKSMEEDGGIQFCTRLRNKSEDGSRRSLC